MCHISMEICANLVANFSESLVIKISWISRETSDNDLWLEFNGSCFKSIIINDSSIKINMILLAFEEYGRG